MNDIKVGDVRWAIYLLQNADRCAKPLDSIWIAPVHVLYIERDNTCICAPRDGKDHSVLGPLQFRPEDLFETPEEAMKHMESVIKKGFQSIHSEWAKIRELGGSPETWTDHCIAIDLNRYKENIHE